MSKRINKAASLLGKRGGDKTKERGSEYYSKISKMKRKHRFCTLRDCDREHYAKGLCNKHYLKKRRACKD